MIFSSIALRSTRFFRCFFLGIILLVANFVIILFLFLWSRRFLWHLLFSILHRIHYAHLILILIFRTRVIILLLTILLIFLFLFLFFFFISSSYATRLADFREYRSLVLSRSLVSSSRFSP
eukprot:UN25569